MFNSNVDIFLDVLLSFITRCGPCHDRKALRKVDIQHSILLIGDILSSGPGLTLHRNLLCDLHHGATVRNEVLQTKHLTVTKCLEERWIFASRVGVEDVEEMVLANTVISRHSGLVLQNQSFNLSNMNRNGHGLQNLKQFNATL